jgi:outer membrane protein OmpA-like peptidoglycan-associated protein
MQLHRSAHRYRCLAAIAVVLLIGGCATSTTTSVPASVEEEPQRILSSAADARQYMDTQELELQEALVDSGVTVERRGDDIILRMPGAATFEPDKADITPAFKKSLTTAAQVLHAYDRTAIDVTGYTDTSGTMIRNMELSLERAEAVTQLLKRQGIPDYRITPRGLGPLNPLADNDSADGRQLNRRVEITVRPLFHLP